MNFPLFDEYLPFLNQFILELVDDYRAGNINSWDELDERVKSFFTPERMEQTETLVPGWKRMASYTDGITLTHVMCVFLGLFMLPEFQSLSLERKQLAKWIVLLHDVEKVHIRGKRDLTHGFRGAALAARTLNDLGFEHTHEYDKFINKWMKLTSSAITTINEGGDPIQDNQKLPDILDGLKQIFNENSPAAVITKGVLLHMSLDVVVEFPQAAPLSEAEIKRYIDPVLMPLLKVMMLADNEGWVLFYPEVRELQRNETIAAFQNAEKIIAAYSENLDKPPVDKEFWASIAKNDYAIPDGHAVDTLTKTLFGYLGSIDSELRDDIAYIIYANWLKREMFTKDEVHVHIEELLSNLEKGIGETESDSVFLRTFSILLLAEIVHNDNKKPLLEKAQIQSILSKGLRYLDEEKDPRGHIPVKGWAHALAHTADLMLVLGKNRHIEKDDLEKILRAIASKLVHSTNWVYVHGEDDRLANAVIMILQRNLVSTDFLRTWLKVFTEPEKSWNGAYMDEGQARAFHNTRNFLRSLSETIRSADELPEKETIAQLIFEALNNLKPY